MLLADLVAAYDTVRATRSRKAKVAALAAALRSAAAGSTEEIAVAAFYLSGALRQRRTGLGWRSLSGLPGPSAEGSLTVLEVDAAFEEMSRLAGAGSQARRTHLGNDLFGRATEDEQAYLRGLVTGELRQGALDALVVEAVAAAAEVPLAAVRRAAMFAGATPPVAVAALTAGAAGLSAFGLEVGRPVRPMLASSAATVEEAFAKTGAERVGVECKLDGIRIQVHKAGQEVRVFTRSLEEITERVPEVVETTLALTADRAVLDGEAIALDLAGRPRPFQETGARTASRLDVATLREQVPLTTYFFDLLHLDGEDLVDLPGEERFTRLAAIAPTTLVPRVVTGDPAEGRRVFDDLLHAGHEGVVVKSLGAAYDAGRRGAAWVKVKPRHTLDLVVLAVEWGSGRRQGLLSNIHLGARNPAVGTGLDGHWVMLGETFKGSRSPIVGGWVPVGKTFKGMTDEMLAWQTERFLGLETHREGHIVYVRPEQVVEVAFDGVQRSSRYAGGVALRFARVVRYRDDKPPSETDSIETLQALLP